MCSPSLQSVVDRRVQTALQHHQERLPAPFLVFVQLDSTGRTSLASFKVLACVVLEV